MSAAPSVHSQTRPAVTNILRPSREFLCRAGLVAIFVVLAHLFRWEWLRFLTSEAILRISAALRMVTERVSPDTIRIDTGIFQFVTACTFVDVFMGSISLIWDLRKSLPRNLWRLAIAAAALFCFNVVRLEIGQILYSRGVPWTVADDIVGGLAYFAVWLVIWRLRTWQIFMPSTEPERAAHLSRCQCRLNTPYHDPAKRKRDRQKHIHCIAHRS